MYTSMPWQKGVLLTHLDTQLHKDYHKLVAMSVTGLAGWLENGLLQIRVIQLEELDFHDEN